MSTKNKKILKNTFKFSDLGAGVFKKAGLSKAPPGISFGLNDYFT